MVAVVYGKNGVMSCPFSGQTLPIVERAKKPVKNDQGRALSLYFKIEFHAKVMLVELLLLKKINQLV